jgi:hypothetical protein
MSEITERRKAENESIFRDANEKIRDVRVELHEIVGRTPFLCECSNADCREVVLLDLADYEFARAAPARFLLVPSHLSTPADVLVEGEGYAIVEKKGVAAEVAEAADPRGGVR